MKYDQAQEAYDLINTSENIGLNCHRNPDPDSVGSALAMRSFLESKGKKVKIYSPNEVPDYLSFLDGVETIEVVDFDTHDFSELELFIFLDTSGLDRVYSHKNPELRVKKMNIDNHETNEKFGDINILDFETSSVAEMLYSLFNDWDFKVSQKEAQYLLSGIIGDTGSFQFEIYKDTFEIANELLKLGVNHKQIIDNFYNKAPLQLIKFWGEVINRLEIDEAGFAWSAIPWRVYKSYEHLDGTRETAASLVIRKVEGTKFGMVITQDDESSVTVSFRARGKTDVAKLAKDLGGGGHPAASGTHIQGKSFSEALEEILEKSRKHAAI